MSLDSLLTTLSREADAQVESELARARAEAQAIDAGARERNERRRAERAATHQTKRRATVETGLLAARREASGELLAARRAFLERVFDAARASLVGELGTSTYRQTLPARVGEALACVGDRSGTLRCHPDILRDIRGIVTGRPRLSTKPEAAVGAGFKVFSDDGAVEVDCTLEARLAALVPRLSIDVLRQLKESCEDGVG